MGRRRKARHKGLGKHRHLKRGIRDLKNRGKDIDQSKLLLHLVYESLDKDHNPDVDVTELKGQGQFYCKYCDRYFVDSNALSGHESTKFHKRRLKQLSTYTEHVP